MSRPFIVGSNAVIWLMAIARYTQNGRFGT